MKVQVGFQGSHLNELLNSLQHLDVVIGSHVNKHALASLAPTLRAQYSILDVFHYHTLAESTRH
jgi:hypothetical protein